MTTISPDLSKYPVAFTQTIRDQYHLSKNPSPLTQHKDVWPRMEKLLEFGKVDYYIWPDLTLNGQIHYHGFIKVNDYTAYQKMLFLLKKTFGYNLFKAIDDVPKWQSYCENKNNLLPLFKLDSPLQNVIKL